MYSPTTHNLLKFLSILNIKNVKYMVDGSADGVVVFKFESRDKSSHSENDSERCSVHLVCVGHISNFKHLKEKNIG